MKCINIYEPVWGHPSGQILLYLRTGHRSAGLLRIDHRDAEHFVMCMVNLRVVKIKHKFCCLSVFWAVYHSQTPCQFYDYCLLINGLILHVNEKDLGGNVYYLNLDVMFYYWGVIFIN